LIIVGNFSFIEKANPDGYNPFIPVIRYIKDNRNASVREVLKDEH
jgi:hypothetical protein